MLLTYNKGSRQVVGNTGTNSQYPNQQPQEVIDYELQRAAEIHGGVASDYGSFVIDDSDTQLIRKILNSPSTYITLNGRGQPVGVETHERITLTKVYYYWHDMAAENDPPDVCTLSPQHLNTRSAVEYFIQLPFNKLDSEVVFTIEPDNSKNKDIPVTVGQVNQEIKFGPNGECGQTNKPTARIAFEFTMPGTYTVRASTKYHGTIEDTLVVVPHSDEAPSTTGPLRAKPWTIVTTAGGVWNPHRSQLSTMQPLQNTIEVKRLEMSDEERQDVKIKELQQQIAGQNAVIDSHGLMFDQLKTLWEDFYKQKPEW